MVSPRRALLSVSEKEGLVEFARGLRELDFELIATEGTAKTLKDAGIPAMTVAKPRVTLAEAIENIDIGGVSLIRAAAKNSARVAVVVRPARYAEVLRALRETKGISQRLRDELALDAFEYTSRYDAAIFNYLAKSQGHVLPPALRLAYDKIADLRYGENPYQKAALYAEPFPYAATATAERLQGKDLSYNNLIDLDAALRVATEFERPAAVIIKHTNPAGVALGPDLAGAYAAAHACDPISAYGGVVGLNRTVDLQTAKAMRGNVLDAVIAPGYEPSALDLLKQKKRGDFLILRTHGELRKDHGVDMVRVLGGVLLQTTDFPVPKPEAFKVVTKASPTQAQMRDILFGITVSRYVKSNSIVLAKGERTVGIGAGQMSRVDACMLARVKAGEAGRGSVAVSDAYFPFRDGLDELAKAGVAAVAQPGGSIRDAEIIAAADEHKIAMVFTGLRLFKH